MNDEFLEAYIRCQKDRSELMIENKRLKELCDKYEEEHKTTFKEWQDTIKRIDKAIKYIEHAQKYGLTAQIMSHLKLYVNGDDVLDILKGSDKE